MNDLSTTTASASVAFPLQHLPSLVMTVLVVSLLLAPSAAATGPFKGFDVEELSAMIQTSHSCRRNTNPGLAVSIVKDGETLLSRGYGVTRPHGNERVDSDTRFNVASLTKAITAAILVKVMDESGRYNLSTPVRDILGHHFRFEDDLRTRQATVEDLLSHKMAIPSNSRMRFDSSLTRRTLVYRVRHLKSYDTFRNTFIYSNLMYGLASRMAEVVGRGGWEGLVRRHLFRPLRMRRSTFSTEADLTEANTAKPYIFYNGNLEPVSFSLPRRYGELVGSGAFITTANDMARWMNFHLSEGLGPGGEAVMRRESVQELHRPRTAMPKSSLPLFRQPAIPVTTSFDIYGLGWWTGYYRGYPILGHSGASYGYRAFVVLVPSLKAGVFICMNGDDRNYAFRGTLLNLILDRILGVVPWVDTNTLCTFPYPWHNVSAPPTPPYDAGRPLAHNLSAYLGVFENPAYGRVEVRLLSGGGPPSRRRSMLGAYSSSSSSSSSSPRLSFLFGFARWDLVPLVPKYAALNSDVSSRAEFPEYFYGVGKGVNAFVDCTSFIIHPPSTGSDVIEEISVPGFEKRLPPVFTRVGSGGQGVKTSAPLLLVVVVVLASLAVVSLLADVSR
ncbi:uncharacterized protein LOC143282408 [Babylonia areolata]|uniref:uncharacterized protein LOC143282408 n=1 Tax=Babylonia areolata TaxID=304850 RepID=UPI003FD49F50